MENFVDQQSMFNYLRNDLRKYKEVFNKAIEHETMYSPLTPTHKYSEEDLKQLPVLNRSDIVNLKEIMDEYYSPLVNKYEERIKAVKESETKERQEKQMAEQARNDL